MIRNSSSRTIRVAGAGPSGLAAAITLARAGLQVEVHEAKREVGARFIGDLQVIENSSEPEDAQDFLRRIGIRPDFYLRPVSSASFFDPRGRERKVRSKRPYGYMVRRGPQEGSLDRGLLAQALEAGATVLFGSRLEAGAADIVATGPATADGLAREITFESSEEERVQVFFDHESAPGGYSYLFILDGVATFGCAILSQFKRIDHYFDESLKNAQRYSPFVLGTNLRTGYSYMNFHLKETATRDGSLFVGEAGGFQDYLFGLGIRYALTSGFLAARSIIEESSYDLMWKHVLAAKQRTSLANRFLYEAGGNRGLSLFTMRASGAGDFGAYLAGWHSDTWWKRALVPVIRRLWKHDGRCLHKPGAHWCRTKRAATELERLGPVAERT